MLEEYFGSYNLQVLDHLSYIFGFQELKFKLQKITNQFKTKYTYANELPHR